MAHADKWLVFAWNIGPHLSIDETPERLDNGETRAELLARSKGLLMMSPDKWIDAQKGRAEILFREFPDIKTAFMLTHSLRMIFSQRCDKE